MNATNYLLNEYRILGVGGVAVEVFDGSYPGGQTDLQGHCYRALKFALVRLLQKLKSSHLSKPLDGGRSDEQDRQTATGRAAGPVSRTEGDIMNGAIPYYKIQRRIARQEARSGFAKPTRPDKFQMLLCNMAHHVNNLLMRIQGYASLMLMDVKEGQAGFERLKHIENYVGYGAVLTSQLLALAGRGVYADPVNIPPLLLEPQGTTGATPGDNEVRSRLFIIGQNEGDLRPGLLSTCRDITQNIAGLFTGIESVSIKGRSSKIEKQYIGKLKAATREGTRIAHDVTAVFHQPACERPVERPVRHRHAFVPQVRAVGVQ